jgi:hypothetical protein
VRPRATARALTRGTEHGGSPGSHGRNWAPAETISDYLRNCREGLETFSHRRLAKLVGVSRIELHRWPLMAELPEDLFEALLRGRKTSSRELANIALALRGHNTPEIERCPHCEGRLRVRRGYSAAAAVIVNKWLDGAA